MDRLETKFAAKKNRVILLGIILAFSLLIFRLFYLQILSNDLFSSQAQRNRMRFVEVEPKRGEILDANGVVLATSQPVYVVSMEYIQDVELRRKTIHILAGLLEPFGMGVGQITEKVESNYRRFEATEILSIPWGLEAAELISTLAERRQDLPGVVISTQPMRVYPEGSLAGHIIGHIGSITAEELEVLDPQHYRNNDKVGKSGLEKALEMLPVSPEEYLGLKGTRGVRQVEVDSTGRPLQEMAFSLEPIPGDSIRLSLDANLQKALEESMDSVIADVMKENSKAGSAAAVAIDVKTGAILAIGSRPGFNPADFVDGLTQEEADYYYNNEQRPEINKAVASVYPPGSTFKMATGIAYLEETGASPYARVTCGGAYWKKPYIRCTGVHGSLDLHRGLAVSCNVFFQYAGDMAGIDAISKISGELGLGVSPGLNDLPVVADGFLPSRESKFNLQQRYLNQRLARYQRQYEETVAEAREEGLAGTELQSVVDSARKRRDDNTRWAEQTFAFEKNWQAYDTFNTSIGQGMNNYSMLQLANYVATIANGGTRYRPYLVQQILSPDGTVVRETEPEILDTVSASQETLQAVQRGMRAVAEPRGTAYFLFSDFPVPVAAKTGTAQTGRSGDDPSKDFHGVFVAYAPYDDPQIAFAGIVEYGRQGGRSAGVIAKAVFAHYFNLGDTVEIDPGYYLESPLEPEEHDEVYIP